MAAVAARLLRGSHALAALSSADARCVVSYMRLLRCAEGKVLMREGEEVANDFMLLILDGEVTVENTVAGRVTPVVVSVLGPGHLLGETGLFDGGPRTATCTAAAPMTAAGLSLAAFKRLIRDEPDVACKLMVGISERMAQRLRDASRQQRVHHQLLTAMQGEVDELHQQLQKVMSGAARRREIGAEGAS